MSRFARIIRFFTPSSARASATFGGTTDLQNPAFWLVDWALGRRTASGEHVTHDSALGLSAYFACLRNGAEDVAKLPREVRRKRKADRGSDLLLDHPLARILKRPNPVMSWGAFAQVMQHRRMGWGNAYAEIVRDGTGTPAELWPVHSSRVRPELKADGRTLVYWVRGEGLREKPFEPRDVFHLRGMGSGVEGYSVVRFASETLGLGLAAQRHAAAFFGEGLAKRLVAFTKQTLNADAREALRKRIEGDREKNPVGSRRMPIVDVEVDVKDLGIPPEEAQFLEQREFGVEEVARWFRMQLAKIQYFKRAQGWSSLDALNTDYVVDFLTPQVQTWEEETTLKLLTEEEVRDGVFVKFVFQGLMRGDVATRITYYSAGYRDGWLSQNDIRDLEDMNPIEDPAADEYRVQAQMTKLEDAGAKPATSPQPEEKSRRPAMPSPASEEPEQTAAPLPKVVSEGQVEALAALLSDVAAGRCSLTDAGRVAREVAPLTLPEALDLFAPAVAERATTPPPPQPPAPPLPKLELRMEKGAIEVVVPPPPAVQVHFERPPDPERVLEFRDGAGRITKMARLRKAEE